jgi:hypothetical protein
VLEAATLPAIEPSPLTLVAAVLAADPAALAAVELVLPPVGESALSGALPPPHATNKIIAAMIQQTCNKRFMSVSKKRSRCDIHNGSGALFVPFKLN